jgi:general secretion pathway protein K
MSRQAFDQILVSLGVTLSPAETTPGSNKAYVVDRSYVYRIKASGSAGRVSRAVDAVVTFDPQQNRDAPPAGKSLGRLLRWRED